MKFVKAFILPAMLLCCTLIFVSCGKDDTPPITNPLTGTQATFDGFTKDDTTYSMIVSNAITTFDFNTIVKTSDNATWKVSGDIQGNLPIPNRVTTLDAGDNTFYIAVTNNGDIENYALKIRRRPVYTVSFNSYGGGTVPTQSIEEGFLAQVPTTTLTKTGMTFKGWDFDFTEPITSARFIDSIWDYNYYTITINTNGGSEIETLSVIYDDSLSTKEPATTKEYSTFAGWYLDPMLVQRFHFNGADATYTNMPAQDIELWVKWEGDPFELMTNYQVELGYGIDTNADWDNIDDFFNFQVETVQYGQMLVMVSTIPFIFKPYNSDFGIAYSFVGWYDGETLLTNTSSGYIFTMPAKNVLITAKFQAALFPREDLPVDEILGKWQVDKIVENRHDQTITYERDMDWESIGGGSIPVWLVFAFQSGHVTFDEHGNCETRMLDDDGILTQYTYEIFENEINIYQDTELLQTAHWHDGKLVVLVSSQGAYIEITYTRQP